MPHSLLLVISLLFGFGMGILSMSTIDIRTDDAKTEKVLTSENVEVLCAEGYKFARFKTDGNLVQIMKSDGYPMECTVK